MKTKREKAHIWSGRWRKMFAASHSQNLRRKNYIIWVPKGERLVTLDPAWDPKMLCYKNLIVLFQSSVNYVCLWYRHLKTHPFFMFWEIFLPCSLTSCYLLYFFFLVNFGGTMMLVHYLWNPSTGIDLIWTYFLMNRLKLYVFGKNSTKVILCSHCIISGSIWYHCVLLLTIAAD